jgi:hypothetical protein
MLGVLAPLSPWACEEGAVGPGDVPSRLAIVRGSGQRGTVGERLDQTLVTRVVDPLGRPVAGVAVRFEVAAGGGTVVPLRDVSAADGTVQADWILGTSAADAQRIEVHLDAVEPPYTAIFTAEPLAGPPTLLQPAAGDGQTRVAGASLRDSVVVQALDRYENPVPDVRVTWTVLTGGGAVSPAAATTGPQGRAGTEWTLGPEPAQNLLQATAADVNSVEFGAVGTPPPAITVLTPDPLVPGDVLTIEGLNFSATPADNQVFVGNTPAEILTVQADRVTAIVPCAPSGPVTVRLTTNGATVTADRTLVFPAPLVLEPGEATALVDPLEGCTELAAPGRYLVTVVNTANAQSVAQVRMRGQSGLPLAAARPERGLPRAPPDAAPTPRAASAEQEAALHARVLDNNLRTLRSATAGARAPGGGWDAARVQLQQFDTLTVRLANPLVNACETFATLRARVVFEGSRVTMLEDITAPLAGRMDSLFVALGDEFENLVDPMIVDHFGDPLALSGGDTGARVYLVFTRRVNELIGNSGFVSASDFLSTDDCPASNGVPAFYGFVPTDSTRAYGDGLIPTRENWFRMVRSLVAHEVRHIASFAERLSRGASSFEAPWLEEAGAMIAEELFARAVFGYQQAGDTRYAESLFCERRPDNASAPQCRDRPLVMFRHFSLLNQYAAGVEVRSILGPAAAGDLTFYGSGWAFLRWIVDHHGQEASILRSITQEANLAGTESIEALTGKDIGELLEAFLRALALDDRPGYLPGDELQRFPGWNLRDIFAGMNQELPLAFPRPFPLAVRSVGYGGFTVDVPVLRGGSGALFELSGATTARQMLSVTRVAGTGPLRVGIVRIE